MKIIIVGAGIGGLSAALALALDKHEVIILESAPKLAEIGAGVQLTPNAIKFFFQWGLRDDIVQKAAFPGKFFIRRWDDGEILREVKISELEGEYGAPYLVVHRGVLHEILHRHTVRAGAEIRVNSRVVKYDLDGSAVVLKDGEIVKADLVVACDGINSFARKELLKDEDQGATKTGWAAYRMMADVDKIKANPKTADLVSQHNNHLWIGDNHLAMTYMIYESTMLNMVMSHPDDVDTTAWTPEQFKTEVKSLFHGWDSRLVELIDMARESIQNYPVYQVVPPVRWVSDSYKFVIMGDAAHAMAFYLSMGISLAVEDAAALRECISLAQSHDAEQPNIAFDLRPALEVFESLRKPRAEAIQKASLHAGNVLQLPAGPERDARDAAMKADRPADKLQAQYAYGIADQEIRDWCYGYDAAEEVRKEWKRRLEAQARSK